MIISRYLIKEVLSTFFAVTLVLLLIILSNQFVRFLGYAASGRMAANILLQSLGYEAVLLLVILMPLGLYISIIVTYSRLYADNELRVCQVYGFGTPSLVRVTAGLAFGVAVIVMILSGWVNPWILVEKDKLLSGASGMENIINTLMPGRFQATNSGDQVVYVEKMSRDHHHVDNIFIALASLTEESLDKKWSVLSAVSGAQMQDAKTKDKFVVAMNGYRYEGIPGQNQQKIIQFKKYAIRLDESSGVSEAAYFDTSKMPMSQLWKERSLNAGNVAELQWRFSMPLSAFLLALLALPLSMVRPRQNRYLNLGPALLIYIVYFELLFVMRDCVQQKKALAGMGMWWVHGALIALIALLWYWQSSHLDIKKRTRSRVTA